MFNFQVSSKNQSNSPEQIISNDETNVNTFENKIETVETIDLN